MTTHPDFYAQHISLLRPMKKKLGYFFLPLVYSNAIQENMNALLYPGFIEELVDIVELQDDKIVVSIHAFR